MAIRMASRFDVRLLLLAFLTDLAAPGPATSAQGVRRNAAWDKGCTAALQYRDGDLLRDWDRANGRYARSAEARADMQRLKDELMSDAAWAMSTPAQLLAVLRIPANAFEGLVATIYPGASLVTVARKGATRVAKAYAARVTLLESRIKTGNLVNSVIQEDLAGIALQTAQEAGGRSLSQAAAAIATIKETLENAKNVDDMLTAKTVVRDQVKRLDRHLVEYDATLSDSREALEAIEAIKTAIDRTCALPNDAERQPQKVQGRGGSAVLIGLLGGLATVGVGLAIAPKEGSESSNGPECDISFRLARQVFLGNRCHLAVVLNQRTCLYDQCFFCTTNCAADPNSVASFPCGPFDDNAVQSGAPGALAAQCR